MIKIKGVSKKYNNRLVVDNVSLNIEKGKITSLIGPNGTGKSTLLSMITHTADRDGGNVYIEGKEIEEYSKEEFAKKVAILKQSNNFNIRLTVKELVEFGRFPYSQGRLTKEDNKYVNEAINYMNLHDIENKYIDELSGGQRQRVLIAMIMAQNTEYIFLDEPLNNLDIKHSVEMMKVLRKLVDDLGKTVVIVIHDINFASCYSDYIAVLKNGKLIKINTAENVVKKEILEDIYEIDFEIKNINNNSICVYY